MLEADLQQHWIPADGRDPRLSCLRSDGRSASVLFVHGAFAHAEIWRPVMRSLRSFGVASAAISLRGHGDSDGRDRLHRWRLNHYERDLLRAIDAVAEERTVLVEHGLGGLLAARIARRIPLGGLLLLAPVPAACWVRHYLRLVWNRPGNYRFALARKRRSDLLTHELMPRSHLFSPFTPPSVVRQYMDIAGPDGWSAVFPEERPLHATRHELGKRIAVIGGTKDGWVSASALRRAAQSFGVEPEWLDGHGHVLPLEMGPRTLALRVMRIRTEC